MTNSLEVIRAPAAGVRRLGVKLDDSQESDKLRAKARQALEAALSSGDEKTRFQAARSLYSYAATKPPSEEEEPEPKALADLGRAWLKGLSALPQDKLEATLSRDDWNAINRVGHRDPELARAFEAWTAKLAEISSRRGPAVKVEDGRLVADSAAPPPKSVVPAPTSAGPIRRRPALEMGQEPASSSRPPP